MIRTVAALALALALTACAHAVVPPPAIAAQVVTQKVLVRVPCLTAGDLPAEPPRIASQLTGFDGHDLLIVDQSALDLRAWGEAVYGKAMACATAQAGLLAPSPGQ